MKKKLLLMTLLVFVVIVGVRLFFHPVIEEYGETTVQYDEQSGTYFAEVTSRYEVEPTAEMKVGMPVSYFKTKGTVMSVLSELKTKEEMVEECKKNVKSGLLLGGCVVWCFGAIFIFSEYLRERKRKMKSL